MPIITIITSIMVIIVIIIISNSNLEVEFELTVSFNASFPSVTSDLLILFQVNHKSPPLKSAEKLKRKEERVNNVVSEGVFVLEISLL